ncbi:MAG: restriction endonuclease subunit S [Abyssibacter sp.]|nr:restriction endonuclease subunit S [Abyssibacter sp.]MCK5858017.1 restriction endonuclease subunit S [Abyssibacter sp.]
MTVERVITEHMDLWTGAVTQKSGSGRGSRSKRELTGIKKLRELILELAVRGKLVRQDLNEEPASQLLKRIADLKVERQRVAGSRKSKSLPEVSPEEVPFELPHNWAHARLGSLVDIVRGITFPASEKSKSPEDGRIACLRTSNVQEQIEWDDLLYIREKFISRKDQFVQPNDIVMSMANSRELVGKVAIIQANPIGSVTFGGFLGVIRPIEVVPAFLMALLRAPQVREELIGSASQTTNIANISIGKLNPLVVGVPPLAEQHRIVEKVDELIALCDQLEQQTGDQIEAHERLVDTLLDTLTRAANAIELAENWARVQQHFDTLFTTEHSIERLKQTILQLAVMGRLVPQDPTEQTADDFLLMVQEERGRLISSGEIRRQKQSAKDSYELASKTLPQGWAEAVIGDLISLISGQHLKGDEYFDQKLGDAIPYLTGPAEFGDVSPLPSRFTNERRAIASAGDILITCKGSGVGKLNLANCEIAISRQLMAARPILVNPAFLQMLLLDLEDAIREKIVGIAIPGISREDVMDAPILVPPFAEQGRIVEMYESLQSMCEQLKQELKAEREVKVQLAHAVVERSVH